MSTLVKKSKNEAVGCGRSAAVDNKTQTKTAVCRLPSAVGLYIHIPFCKQKCAYCDFNSYAGKEELIEPYVEALVSEIRGSSVVSGRLSAVDTIYIGGGNPARLNSDQLRRIMNAARTEFSLALDAEISIEANPEDLSAEILVSWLDIGFNRLSLGFQSFNDEKLRILGRRHTASQAITAYKAARQAGFRNINIDLIFGLPGQTLAGWREELRQVMALEPEHISAYGLTLEPGTALYRAVKSGRTSLPDEETQARMMEITENYLTKPVGRGLLRHKKTSPCHNAKASAREPLPVPHYPSPIYIHYELSNFARLGFECRHNLNYWRGGNYLGFGSGAHSHMNGRRWWNLASPQNYIKTIRSEASPTAGEEVLSPNDRLVEAIFLGLRLTDGVSINDIQNRFGANLQEKYANELDSLINDGLLTAGERWALTPKGRLLANEVMAQFVGV